MKKKYIPPFLYARMLGKPLVLSESQEDPIPPVDTTPTLNWVGDDGAVEGKDSNENTVIYRGGWD